MTWVGVTLATLGLIGLGWGALGRYTGDDCSEDDGTLMLSGAICAGWGFFFIALGAWS